MYSMCKLLENIRVLLSPTFWDRCYPISYEWDRKFNKLMDEHKFIIEDGQQRCAKLGDVEVRIKGTPYTMFTERYGQLLPTRKTSMRAMDKLNQECPYNERTRTTNYDAGICPILPAHSRHGVPIADLLTKDGFKIAPQRMSNKNQILDGYELKSHIYTGTYDEIKSMLMPDKDKILYLWDNGFYPWYNLEYSYKIDRYDRYAWIAVATR